MKLNPKHDPHCDCGICAYCNGQEDIWGNKKSEAVIRHARVQPSDDARVEDYVAWCRYTYDESGGIKSIVTCDSDAKGAFKVYREPLSRLKDGEAGDRQSQSQPNYGVVIEAMIKSVLRFDNEQHSIGNQKRELLLRLRDELRATTPTESSDPWCEPCQSYHPVPRDAAHKTSLKCLAGVTEQAADVDYTQGGRLPSVEEMCGSIDYGGRVSVNEDNELVIVGRTHTPPIAQPTYPHCHLRECECSDFDVSPDMGAKG